MKKIATMRAFGATVHVAPAGVTKDSPDHYMNKAASLAKENPDAVYLNQYANPINVTAHL